MARVRVKTWLGCRCGNNNLIRDNEDGTLNCEKCGISDYDDAFIQMELINDILECRHCKEEVKQELYSYDAWGGTTETTCTKCKNMNVFE